MNVTRAFPLSVNVTLKPSILKVSLEIAIPNFLFKTKFYRSVIQRRQRRLMFMIVDVVCKWTVERVICFVLNGQSRVCSSKKSHKTFHAVSRNWCVDRRLPPIQKIARAFALIAVCIFWGKRLAALFLPFSDEPRRPTLETKGLMFP